MSYYECPKCGAQTDIDKSVLTRCPVCGDPVPEDKREAMREHIKLMKEVDEILSEPEVEEDEQHDDKKYIFCPKCLSYKLTVREKGYNVGKATTASILNARNAWLWGMWDMNDRICTCSECGNEFEAKEGVHASFKQIENAKHYVERNLRKKNDVAIRSDLGSKMGVHGVDVSYMRRIRDKKGISHNPGFDFQFFIIVELILAALVKACSWLFHFSFWTPFLICSAIMLLYTIFERSK